MSFILFTLIGISIACQLEPPVCHWSCDDPQCSAVCEPVCIEPVCEVCVNITSLTCVATHRCTTQCPVDSDQCEPDSCPQCVTMCPNLCHGKLNCSVQCLAPDCSWRCRKPTLRECPAPICVLQCEHPSCEYVNSGVTDRKSVV